MISKREQEKQEKSPQQLNETVWVSEAIAIDDNTPPPAARSISELIFPNKEIENNTTARLTYHLTNTCYKRKKNGKLGQLGFFKHAKLAGEKYSEKQLQAMEAAIQLEGYAWRVCQLLARKNIPPMTRAYYDENKRLIGVRSKELLGFKPNREDELQEKDLIIEMMVKNIPQQKALRNNLLEGIKSLSKIYQAKYTTGVSATVRWAYSRYVTLSQTSAQTEDLVLKPFLQHEDPFCKESLLDLLTKLTERRKHILTLPHSEEIKSELGILKTVISIITRLQVCAQDNDINNIDVKYLVEIDKILAKKKIAFDGCDFVVASMLPTVDNIHNLPNINRCAYVLFENKFFYVDKLGKKCQPINIDVNQLKKLMVEFKINEKDIKEKGPCVAKFLSADQLALVKAITGHTYPQKEIENTELIETVFGKPVIIKAKHLRNYNSIRGIMVSACLSDIFQNYDPHCNNIGKKGLIDYDKFEYWLSYLFNVSDTTLPGKFPVTARDIRNFPNIEDALPDFYWWLTKETIVAKTKMDALRFDITKNFFAEKHNQVFKQLALHPVAEYIKNEIFFSFILTCKEMYKSIAEQNFKKNFTYENINAPVALPKHDIERRKEFERILFSMPESSDFLAKHGDYVFASFCEDLRELQNTLHKPEDRSLKAALQSALYAADCDLVVQSEFIWPEDETAQEKLVQLLLGSSTICFILTEKEFFYVDKSELICTRIKLDDKQLNLLYKEFPGFVSKQEIGKLTEKQLSRIQDITGFAHSSRMLKKYQNACETTHANKAKQPTPANTMIESIVLTDTNSSNTRTSPKML